jgi:hypothetical protein
MADFTAQSGDNVMNDNTDKSQILDGNVPGTNDSFLKDEKKTDLKK